MPAPADKRSSSAAADTSTSTDFESVAESVAPRLYRIAMRMCGKPEDAEDLVQDTLLQGFRNWGQFERRSAPSTWLYTIAARLCQRRRRRRSGEPLRLEPLTDLLPSPSDPVLTIPSSGDGPLDEHLRREAERAVADALALLPDHVRLPLVLADIAELSTGEIARILGLKEATAKTRIHRGRLMVRRVLLERLSVRPAPPSTHDRHVCLDLLRAKQEAMDRRAPFRFSGEELCARCQAVFATLDLGRDVCRLLGDDTLPESLHALIRTHHTRPDEHPRRRPPAAGTRRTRT